MDNSKLIRLQHLKNQIKKNAFFDKISQITQIEKTKYKLSDFYCNKINNCYNKTGRMILYLDKLDFKEIILKNIIVEKVIIIPNDIQEYESFIINKVNFTQNFHNIIFLINDFHIFDVNKNYILSAYYELDDLNYKNVTIIGPADFDSGGDSIIE